MASRSLGDIGALDVGSITGFSSSAISPIKRDGDRSIKPRPCPRCDNITLKNISLNRDRNFAIDQCPSCGGHWLDIGELEKLRKESKHMAEFEANQVAFEAKLKEELKDPSTQRRALAFMKVLYK